MAVKVKEPRRVENASDLEGLKEGAPIIIPSTTQGHFVEISKLGGNDVVVVIRTDGNIIRESSYYILEDGKIISNCGYRSGSDIDADTLMKYQRILGRSQR